MPWPHQEPNKINSSLQMENKQIQPEHINTENFWKTCIKLLKFWQKHSSKTGLEFVRTYSLQWLTQNSLKIRVRQPLCDPSNPRKMDKWEDQSLDDLLDLGPRPWDNSRGVTDQHTTNDSITKFETVVLHAYKPEKIAKLLSWIH